jgi:hypothetical protein
MKSGMESNAGGGTNILSAAKITGGFAKGGIFKGGMVRTMAAGSNFKSLGLTK